MIARAAAVLALLVSTVACSNLQQSAQKDPLKCERDPKCTQKSRAADCSRQCSDDPACVDRCREMGVTSGSQDR